MSDKLPWHRQCARCKEQIAVEDLWTLFGPSQQRFDFCPECSTAFDLFIDNPDQGANS